MMLVIKADADMGAMFILCFVAFNSNSASPERKNVGWALTLV
jgi:hypothetical protein